MSDSPDIRPGDVLLFHGNGFVSWAIRWFDGTDVNHTAIAIDADNMGEAVGSGLRDDPIAAAIKSNVRTYVRRLPVTSAMTPVVSVAQKYLDSNVPYAYEELVLLAVLSMTRRAPISNPLMRRVLRSTLDHAAELLNSLVDRGSDLMICSEYVYRCYDEAGDPAFHLTIDGTAMVAAEADSDGTLLEWARTQPDPPPKADLGAVASPRDPDVIVAEANAELEPLLAQLAMEQQPEEAAALGMPAELAPQPDVSDGELQSVAVAFRDSMIAVRTATLVAAPVAAIGPWNEFQTVADFVTPGDLFVRCSSLQTVATLEP